MCAGKYFILANSVVLNIYYKHRLRNYMRKTDWEWKKKCVKLKPEEFAAFDRAAKDGGYRNGHQRVSEKGVEKLPRL